ncbi:hypothetical protein TA3x_005128 [Tundrisphaera sp. TA3]|uniref:hypothetical protein n=1 Tax=Tundrisphaera sp. TA3 TaxID=3435775 RepID=UPI003EBA6970
MSTSVIIANMDRREFLDAYAFGRQMQPRDYINGHAAVAVSMLTCDASRSVGEITPLAGSWNGCNVIAVSDAGPPDAEGFITSAQDDPLRNLYSLIIDEFRDISLDAIAMICERFPEIADSLALQAKDKYSGSKQWGSQFFFRSRQMRFGSQCAKFGFSPSTSLWRQLERNPLADSY